MLKLSLCHLASTLLLLRRELGIDRGVVERLLDVVRIDVVELSQVNRGLGVHQELLLSKRLMLKV